MRRLFLQLFVSLLRGYDRFFVVVRVNPDPIVQFDRAAFFHSKRVAPVKSPVRNSQGAGDAGDAERGEGQSRAEETETETETSEG